MITFPLWFKIFLGLFGFGIITGTIRFLSKSKIIDSIKKLPDDKMGPMVKSYSRLQKFIKYFLWGMPFYFILVPYLIYLYSPENLFHFVVMIAVSYIYAIEEFFYLKSILSSLKT